MAALVGRKVTFTPTSGGVPVIGVRTKTITLNNEPIDITSDDDNGFRTLLGDDPAERSIDFSAEGILKDSQLIALAAQGGSMLIESYDMDIDGIGTFSGDFYFGSIEIGAPYNDAVTFSATIQSSGPFTFAAVTT
jgi:predicted secreted protein